ncbi:MAG: DUF1648 domain-containing protein [Terriglobales bacterium]
MDSRLYRAMTAVLWLAAPLTALHYWSVWDKLPARMATHFGLSGQPNGWMPRETALIFAIALTVFLLVVFTWVLVRMRKPDILAWSLLAMLFVMMGVVYSINAALLDYNLYHKPLNITIPMIALFVASCIVVAIALMSKRGPELPRHRETYQAEEVHAAPLWGMAFILLTIFELGVSAVIPLHDLDHVRVGKCGGYGRPEGGAQHLTPASLRLLGGEGEEISHGHSRVAEWSLVCAPARPASAARRR